MLDSFSTHSQLIVAGKSYYYTSLAKFSEKHDISELPFALKILLENCLRREDGNQVKAEDILAIAKRANSPYEEKEISFMPARVLLQDFTGVPAVVDLAAMRDAMEQLGGSPCSINPLEPVELVIDHSIQVDNFGAKNSKDLNAKIEFNRNKERYKFLRWGQNAFANFKVVPPDTGIVHQVNLEYLARVVSTKEIDNSNWVYPDTLVGTDSHTTMINGLGILGWGVGGIEAEAAMLGQPISMLIPEVIGFKIEGELREGTTATDLVLTITEMLRKKGVVGKFVEFYGDGLKYLPLADRATIANMAPEYGATCGLFPIDEETLNYMRLTGRSEEQIELTEKYATAQGMFRVEGAGHAKYDDILELDLDCVEPSIAGPKRPQDRIPLSKSKESFLKTFAEADVKREISPKTQLQDGAIVIAAITSCTNTSNPYVMIAAGLVAKKAVEAGLKIPDWVKTSLAPGSKVVTEYLNSAGLMPYLEELKFHLVGYGCTTCIGNSGPLPERVSSDINTKNLHVCSILSGNRNFEGRVHPEVRMNYLASPPLVIAYALAGRMDIDLQNDPIGQGEKGDVYLRDIWPTQKEIKQFVEQNLQAEMFTKSYSLVFDGDENWNSLDIPKGNLYAWQEDSTYVRRAPYFDNMGTTPEPVENIKQARVLAILGDSVTTDHISPAGNIKADSPAGNYLREHGVLVQDFNSYGSRRGNHEVMVRGTFANIRLRNQMVPGVEGGFTKHVPSNQQMSIFDAAEKYKAENVPLIILAGKEYGSGSSRDWAAKGPRLLGVKAVIAESFERIHRSNLVGMGILPLVFQNGESAQSLGLTGSESFDIIGLNDGESSEVTIIATSNDGSKKEFVAKVRLDTPQEVTYYKHGGILLYVLRNLINKA